MDEITLLLLLHNRSEFNQRWLDFHTPLLDEGVEIYIADGSKSMDKRLKEFSLKNQRIEYQYIQPDDDIQKFVQKTVLALSQIDTKYTIMCSNDDLVGRSARTKMVLFLQENADYVCAMGINQNFATSFFPNQSNSLNGTIVYSNQIGNLGPYDEELKERLLRYSQNSESYWHGTVKTEILLEAWEKAETLGINSYQELDLFLNLYMLCKGKFYFSDRYISVFHQVHYDMIAQKLPNIRENLSDPIWNRGVKNIFDFLEREFKIGSIDAKAIYESYLTNRQLEISSKPAKNITIWKRVFNKLSYEYHKRLNSIIRIHGDIQIGKNCIDDLKEIENFLMSFK